MVEITPENVETPPAGTPPATEPKPPQEPSKPERTELEKAEYNLGKNAQRVKELGGDPASIVGSPTVPIDSTLSDDTPLTVGALRQIQKQEVKKTSLQLADAIEDETEKSAVKEILGRLEPSGSPQQDFNLARSAVNAERTRQIAEDNLRNGTAQPGAPGGSAPGITEKPFEATAAELVFMGPPYNLTKEQILAARPKA